MWTRNNMRIIDQAPVSLADANISSNSSLIKQILSAHTRHTLPDTNARLKELGLFLKTKSECHTTNDIRSQFRLLSRMDKVIPGHVPKVFMLLELRGQQAYLLERIDGNTPEWHRLNRSWPFQISIEEVTNELVRVVTVLHRHDIVHSDIHEQNVILKEGTASPVMIDPDCSSIGRGLPIERLKQLDLDNVYQRVKYCLQMVFRPSI